MNDTNKVTLEDQRNMLIEKNQKFHEIFLGTMSGDDSSYTNSWEQVTLTLPRVCHVSWIDYTLWFYDGRIYTVDLDVSIDGNDWVKICNKKYCSGNGIFLINRDIKYIRLFGTNDRNNVLHFIYFSLK